MYNNIFIRLICSLPVILVLTYYIPFLGFVLVCFRYYVYGKNKVYFIPSTFLTMGVLIVIPKLVYKIMLVTPYKIPYLDTVVNSSIYGEFLHLSKTLIIFAVVFAIVSYVVVKLIDGAKGFVSNYVREQETIAAKETAKMRAASEEKRVVSANTRVVTCSKCGATNTVTSNGECCKYCRNPLG